ncbi:MAG: zinc ribbon domain-containing protein [Mycobacterium sp.]
MTRSARGTRDQPGIQVAQKRGLNRAIRHQGWGRLVTRLDHKAAGGLERVPAAYTSQRCCACGPVAPENRKSQAVFACVCLWRGAVPRRCERCPQHRRRTGGTSTGRPRRRAVCEL